MPISPKNLKRGIKRSSPLKIGLTGGIGAGKSLALKILSEEGIPTLQTDHLGHELLQSKKIISLLAREFGTSILDDRGGIDRQKLGREVFGDPKKRKALNRVLHPPIRKTVAKWVLAQKRRDFPVVVVEVPLLFEGGFYRWFDGVLSVSAPKAIRQKRLLRRGWTSSEILKRERAQWPQTRKNHMSNWVISNQGSRKDLKNNVKAWIQKIQLFVKSPK